jgi:hypothetical protein
MIWVLSWLLVLLELLSWLLLLLLCDYPQTPGLSCAERD